MKKSAVRKEKGRVIKPGEQKCFSCGEILERASEFFRNNDSLLFTSNDGYVHICKRCASEIFDRYREKYNVEVAMKYICMFFDMGYNDALVDKIKDIIIANKANHTMVGLYFSQRTLVQFKCGAYSDDTNSKLIVTFEKQAKALQDKNSALEETVRVNEDRYQETLREKDAYTARLEESLQKMEEESRLALDVETLTDSDVKTLRVKWGASFSNLEFIRLESLYREMAEFNPRMAESPQVKDYLKKICLAAVLLDRAYAENDTDAIKALGGQYSKFMQDSKLRAMDETETDRTGGVRTFAQIYAEVEKDDFIPPWAHYQKLRGVKQDIVDKTIMHILNHTRGFRKEEKFNKPPDGTPKLNKDEIDGDAVIFRDSLGDSGD